MFVRYAFFECFRVEFTRFNNTHAGDQCRTNSFDATTPILLLVDKFANTFAVVCIMTGVDLGFDPTVLWL